MGVSELSLTLLAFLTGLSFAVVAPVLPLYVESFGVSYEVLGLFFSAYSLTWGLLQLYTGYLSDRYGRRRLALMGLAIYSLSALGCAEARSFPQLLVFRIIQGVGLGLFGPAVLGLVAGMKRQGQAFALYRTALVHQLLSLAPPVYSGTLLTAYGPTCACRAFGYNRCQQGTWTHRPPHPPTTLAGALSHCRGWLSRWRRQRCWPLSSLRQMGS
jgi:MFS family permease